MREALFLIRFLCFAGLVFVARDPVLELFRSLLDFMQGIYVVHFMQTVWRNHAAVFAAGNEVSGAAYSAEGG
ncbi:MAG: hypothetical protein ACRDGA_10855 [Bacteroidota bacterium]